MQKDQRRNCFTEATSLHLSLELLNSKCTAIEELCVHQHCNGATPVEDFLLLTGQALLYFALFSLTFVPSSGSVELSFPSCKSPAQKASLALRRVRAFFHASLY